MKPPTSTAWENGPTGGVSSGEVIAVLLMANSFGHSVRWSEPRDRQCAEFESHGIEFPHTQELLLAANRQFPQFIILTIILPYTHASAIRRREDQEGISRDGGHP